MEPIRNGGAANSVGAAGARKAYARRVKWTTGELDFSLLACLGDFARAFDGSASPSLTDLEKLANFIMQREGGLATFLSSEEGAAAMEALELEGLGGGGGGGKRQKLAKGYAWGENGCGDLGAEGGPNTESIVPRRPLDKARTKLFFQQLEAAAPQEYPQLVSVIESALSMYQARSIDRLALAAIMRSLLDRHGDLLFEFFVLTSPVDVRSWQSAIEYRRTLDPTPGWVMARDEIRKPPLSKRAPPEKPIPGVHSTLEANMTAGQRLDQAARLLSTGPAEDFAKHFLLRARTELGEYYQWLLDNLVAMRMSLRANQFVAFEGVRWRICEGVLRGCSLLLYSWQLFF